MAKRKGIIFASLERLHTLMALNESRYQAKQHLRASGEHTWSFSTGKIHSLTTRGVYQQHILAFVNWSREQYGIRHLEDLDWRANELATEYLTEEALMHSPYTVATQRSALRMFFSNRSLADSVVLPKRQRSQIKRSRGQVAQDREFQPLNWKGEIAFLKICGLRRFEALALLVNDVSSDGRIIHVRRGKGGKPRDVPVLPGYEQVILNMRERRDGEEHVLKRLPVRLDVHSLRREYAQALYLHHAKKKILPPSEGHLSPRSYDKAAVMIVSRALGHNRLDIVLRHYLR